jgi:SPP1 family predicted phage head-tail adaptor
MDRGQFDRLITVQRATVVVDDYGAETPTWAQYAQAWAKVKFGTAQEKREAAQEGGVQSATFEVYPTPLLSAVTLTDRIQFDGSAWDITEVAPLDRHLLRFTAARAR